MNTNIRIFVGGRASRVARIACATAAAILSQAFTGQIASAQRTAAITEIEEIEYAPTMTFYIQYDPSKVVNNDVYQANNSTEDDDAAYVGTGDGSGDVTVPSNWEDVDTTYTFFIGEKDGTHCQWQGIYVTE